MGAPMLFRFMFCAGTCLALAATPSLVLAQSATATTGGVQQATAPPKAIASGVKHYDPDEVICRYTSKTGTRFLVKACLRRADWDQLAQDSKDDLNHLTSLKAKSGV